MPLGTKMLTWTSKSHLARDFVWIIWSVTSLIFYRTSVHFILGVSSTCTYHPQWTTRCTDFLLDIWGHWARRLRDSLAQCVVWVVRKLREANRGRIIDTTIRTKATKAELCYGKCNGFRIVLFGGAIWKHSCAAVLCHPNSFRLAFFQTPVNSIQSCAAVHQ